MQHLAKLETYQRLYYRAKCVCVWEGGWVQNNYAASGVASCHTVAVVTLQPVATLNTV